MRTLGTAIVALSLLSCSAAADEPIAALSEPVVDTAEAEVTYPLKWQRRLLAVQLAFAATLNKVDPVETGSITLRDQ